MFYVGALQAVNPDGKEFVWEFTCEIICALISAILEVAVRWTLRLVPPVLSESAAIYCVSALLAAIPASVAASRRGWRLWGRCTSSKPRSYGASDRVAGMSE